MTDQLKRKLERQNKATERALTGYSLSQKKANRLTYSTNRLYNHNSTTERETFSPLKK